MRHEMAQSQRLIKHHPQWGRNLSPDCWTPVDFIICLSIFLRNVWRGGCQDSKHFMRRSAALCEGTCNMGWGCCKPHRASWTTQIDIFYNTALLIWIKTSLYIYIYSHIYVYRETCIDTELTYPFNFQFWWIFFLITTQVVLGCNIRTIWRKKEKKIKKLSSSNRQLHSRTVLETFHEHVSKSDTLSVEPGVVWLYLQLLKSLGSWSLLLPLILMSSCCRTQLDRKGFAPWHPATTVEHRESYLVIMLMKSHNTFSIRPEISFSFQ